MNLDEYLHMDCIVKNDGRGLNDYSLMNDETDLHTARSLRQVVLQKQVKVVISNINQSISIFESKFLFVDCYKLLFPISEFI